MNRRETPSTLLHATLRDRPDVSATDLRGAFAQAGLSASSLQRAVAAAGADILRLGDARATRYALTREVLGAGRHWPLMAIDAIGVARHVATLHALQNDHWAVEPVSGVQGAPDYLLIGAERGGLFYGLPWYLTNFRPDGFVGRNFAHQWAGLLGAPSDIRDWTADHVLLAAARGVIDPLGSFVIKHLDPLRRQPEVPQARRVETYARLAASAVAGEPVGSSAGGEQPKFTARLQRADGDSAEVIVKFSPPRDLPAGQRWADLLVCEHLAAQVLGQRGIPVSLTDLVEDDTRSYLEIERFDRVGERGRRGTCLFSAIAPALGGPPQSWSAAAQFLCGLGLVEPEVVERAEFLDAFGAHIANTDRHLGNLSLLLDGGPPFTLAPVYDMLPMMYRPSSTGELVDRELSVIGHDHADAKELAAEYWRRVVEHPLLSDDFRRIAEQNERLL